MAAGIEGARPAQEVRLRLGAGFYAAPAGPAAAPVARVLVELEYKGGRVRRLGAAELWVEGRAGAVLVDSPFTGTTTDWALPAEQGWAPAAAAASAPRGVLVPRATPAAAVGAAVRAARGAAVNGSCWPHAFPCHPVGSVEVGAGAYPGPGRNSPAHHLSIVRNPTTWPHHCR